MEEECDLNTVGFFVWFECVLNKYFTCGGLLIGWGCVVIVDLLMGNGC